jgi:hypothetical protein
MAKRALMAASVALVMALTAGCAETSPIVSQTDHCIAAVHKYEGDAYTRFTPSEKEAAKVRQACKSIQVTD